MKIRSLLIAVALCLSSPAALRAENLPPQLLPVFGGLGGTAFTRDCGKGYVLTGLRWRSGAVVDAIGIMCRPVKSDGTLGPETTIGTLAGGGGGSSGAASCGEGRALRGDEPAGPRDSRPCRHFRGRDRPHL